MSTGEMPEVDPQESEVNEDDIVFRDQNAQGFKKLAQTVAASTGLEILVIICIIINTGILMVQNPANSYAPEWQTGFVVADLILSSIFTIEMMTKIIAMELIGKNAYLDDAWNKLDFIVVLSSWVNILVELFDFDLGIEVSTLRALRILRVLRSLKFSQGIKTIMTTIADAMPLAANVVVFIAFLFVVSGIIGVQMFRGSTSRRCAPGGWDFMATMNDMEITFHDTPTPELWSVPLKKLGEPEDKWTNLAPENHLFANMRIKDGDTTNVHKPNAHGVNGSVVCDGGDEMALPGKMTSDDLGLSGEYPIGIGMWHTYCKEHSDCPMFDQETYDATGCSLQLCFEVPNPGKGVHSYDNILYAWVALFINMACLYWWETAHRFFDPQHNLGSTIAWGFGFLNVFFLTYVSVNMFVAVITTVFADVRSLENPSGGMAEAGMNNEQKWAAKRKKYEERHQRWTKPPYFLAFFGGRGPYEEKQHPNVNNYPMTEALRLEVLITALPNHLTNKVWKEGNVIEVDEEEKKYLVRFLDDGEELWIKRGRIKVSPEVEKQGLIYHPAFDTIIMAFIFWNTGTLAAEHHDPDSCQGTGEPTVLCQSDAFQGNMGKMELIFNFVFTIECIMKVSGLGFKNYISVGFNRLDFFIVVTSLMDMASAAMETGDDGGGLGSIFKLFRVFRLFRVLRVARILYRNESLRKLLETVFGSGEALANLTAFILFANVLFGIMGMHLFGGNYIELDGSDSYFGKLMGPASYYRHHTNEHGTWSEFSHGHDSRTTYGYDVSDLINKTLIPRRNFEDMPRAFLLAFQIMTGDDWVNQMHDHMAIYNLWAPPMLFFVCFVFCNYTVLSLFIAVILENFEIAEAEKLALQKEAAVKKREEDAKTKEDPKVSFVHRLTWLAGGEGKREGSKWSYARPANTDDEGYFIPGEKWYNDDVSLFVLKPDNPFRKLCMVVATNAWFDRIILVAILIGTFMLAAEGPKDTLDPKILDKFEYISHFLFGVFMVEFGVKLCAMGFLFTPKAYLKDPWNKLDFVVITASIMGYFFKLGDVGRILRLGRCLRPLRIINRNEGMKVIITAVVNSLAVNLGVLSLAFMLLLIFGILGVSLFAGQFHFCTCSHAWPLSTSLVNIASKLHGPANNSWPDPTKLEFPNLVVTRSDCVGEHRANNETVWGIDPNFPNAVSKCVWDNPPYNFDTCWDGIMALFTMSTLAGWTDIMERGLDMVGLDRQPVFFNSWYFAIYFIMFVMVMAFFITNLFIGVLIDFIGHSDGSALVTEEQQKWIDTQRFQKAHATIEKVLNVEDMPGCRRFFYNIVESPTWDNISNFVIVFNVFIMMLEHEGMSQFFEDSLEYLNTACLLYFTVEMAFKLAGYWPIVYWKDDWNKFDAIVVTISWVAIVASIIGWKVNVQAVRAFRAFRIVLVLKRAKGIRSLFGTLMMSIPAAFNISVLLGLLYALYAILGMQIFGGAEIQDVSYWHKEECYKGYCFTRMIDRLEFDDNCSPDDTRYHNDEDYPCLSLSGVMLHGGNRQYTYHSSFRSFKSAMSLLFQCATGQDWKFIMYALESQQTKTTIFTYFATFFFFSNYILANLFVAVILDNFSACLREEELEIREEDILIFKREFRARTDDKKPEILTWDKLEGLMKSLGDERSEDEVTGQILEFPLVPPFSLEWTEGQDSAWKSLTGGKSDIKASGLQAFMEAAYNSTPLIDDDGSVCNPLYGEFCPGGFGPSGSAAQGGQFGRYWDIFKGLRTTSVERMGDGAPEIEGVMDYLADPAGGDCMVSVGSLEAFIKTARFREKYQMVVKELEFHAVVYLSQDSFIRYTNLMQAMVNARLGNDALSLEEQIARGLVTLDIEDDDTPSKNLTTNPIFADDTDDDDDDNDNGGEGGGEDEGVAKTAEE